MKKMFENQISDRDTSMPRKNVTVYYKKETDTVYEVDMRNREYRITTNTDSAERQIGEWISTDSLPFDVTA